MADVNGHPLAKSIRGLRERGEPIGRMMAENLAEEFDRLHKIAARLGGLLEAARPFAEKPRQSAADVINLRAAIAECEDPDG